jgi:hypothetical protein
VHVDGALAPESDMRSMSLPTDQRPVIPARAEALARLGYRFSGLSE